MWLKQMVLDGFKSYANRTVIDGWDRHFTAITGLNGSGKSNILDGICFVLGITNLTQVRVTNLQQLVYKEGQARVTKASVSLIFDNTNKNDTPIGYEEYDTITITRQVIIGGRNKYMINGQTAQLSRIRDLFHSVQLDVNNPHFLIMQGRITKVLNMKPIEILGMIQEAAGTKMYEIKKKQALKTMEKKQIKVNEINDILERDITPQLHKLRNEKTHYLQWTRNSDKIEKLNRLLLVQNFLKSKQEMESSNEELIDSENKLNQIIEEISLLQDSITKYETEIQQKQEQLSNSQTSEYKKLTNNINDIQKNIKKLEQQNKNILDSIKNDKNELNNINKQLNNNKKIIDKKNNEFNQSNNEYNIILEEYKYIENRIESLQSQKLGINIDNNDENDDNNKQKKGSLNNQLMNEKKNKTKLLTLIKKLDKNIKNNENNVNKLKKKLNKFEKEFKKLENKKVNIENTLNEYKNELNKINNIGNNINIDNDDDIDMNMNMDNNVNNNNSIIENENDIKHELMNKTREIHKIKNEIESLSHHIDRLKFNYQLPYPNFNTNKVIGVVGELINVKNDLNIKAIEITAGGRLYNVIVDTNKTGAELLKKGKLKRRTTFIPLNKIHGKTITNEQINLGKQLVGDEHCNIAIELIEYQNNISKAMEYVFGSTLICTDMNIAKKVTFDKNIKCKSVTLNGEVFNPSGTLTGGSSKRDNSILRSLRQYNMYLNRYNELNKSIKILNNKLNKIESKKKELDNITDKIEMTEHELQVINDEIKDSEFGDVMQQIEKLNNEINNNKSEIEKTNILIKKCDDKILDIKNDIENYENSTENQTQLLNKKIKENQIKLKKTNEKLVKATELKNNLESELNDLNEDNNGLIENIDIINKQINDNNDNIKKTNKKINELINEQKTLEIELKKEQQRLDEQNNEIKKLSSLIKKNKSDLFKKETKKTKIENFIKKCNQKIKIYNNNIIEMLNKYQWLNNDTNNGENIENLKNIYINNNNNYNYNNINDINKELNKLKNEQNNLQKKINHKVMGMFERAENEYKDLVKKRHIIRNDKKKIEAVIKELDRKKEDTLKSTFIKVNEHLSNIFSRLLPGTNAKLCIVDENNSSNNSKLSNDNNNNDNKKNKNKNNNNNNNNNDDDMKIDNNINTNNLSILNGVEIKVAFGDVWKESLSELSGGQRSLLALSLILSLLLFKPAPLYILDEIDAALDLSHTQNIGTLIDRYFNQSQFIVVSLKEGMFNNANVIFKTSFIDGVSQVKRTVKHRNKRK